MARKGYDLTIVYLDDFLIIAKSKLVCAETIQTLILLLQKLGFLIHWGKVVDPTTCITFLGIALKITEMMQEANQILFIPFINQSNTP